MNDYAVILEMRKKKIGFFVHLIHFILTICTMVWGLVWLGHYLHVYFHNAKIERQIDALIDANTMNIVTKLKEKRSWVN